MIKQYKYRIYCETEQTFVDKETLAPAAVCPNDRNHTVQSGSYRILDEACTKDYKQLRTELIMSIINDGFENLTLEEQMLAVQNFCLPKEVRDMFYTVDQQIIFGLDFHQASTEAREIRANKVMVEMYNHLNLQDAFIIGQSVRDKVDEYIRYGLEGTPEGDVEGIFNFFLATSGTSYENTGFPTMTGVTPITDITISGLADVCYKILKYGTKDV